ncbi:hypothetical protein [Enterococcus wangshanyuanii]|uniref:Uncharacterized protein n=1 Tax=Enterococcus wangshanyuanii TaxID=2005703 RepID=A0ABQ1PX85_9ENTE|nr:hypothetical protein [Enterococcus wangshanyuanii]GGD06053.1 hypothetical protein GCM10011573_39320 [Enterococcus wangshanyuanii]
MSVITKAFDLEMIWLPLERDYFDILDLNLKQSGIDLTVNEAKIQTLKQQHKKAMFQTLDGLYDQLKTGELTFDRVRRKFDILQFDLKDEVVTFINEIKKVNS